MPYKFTFDLSRISQSLFKEVLRLSGEKKVHKRLGNRIRDLVKRLRIERITGLNFSDAITVIEDLIDIQIKNLSERDRFLKTKKRALLLPHCARKYMDSRCKALFDAKKSSYFCQGCSPDCLVNRATQIAKKKGYDVYILPGGSCIPAIIKGNRYEGISGSRSPLNKEWMRQYQIQYRDTSRDFIDCSPYSSMAFCSLSSF